MNVWHLVLREIAHRRLNFALGFLSVTIAVACLVGAMTLLHAHEIETNALLAKQKIAVEARIAKQEIDVRKAGKELEDATRKITLGLGFNILILPEDQDPHELNVEGTLSKTMPEEYVSRLANSNIVVINHLLPIVTRKVNWDEMDQTVLLTGTRGEVPLMHRDPKKPLQDHVPEGTMVLGYQVHKRNKLAAGDEVTFMGRPFKVTTLYDERGSADDSTIWINLQEAQELLGLQNLVNAVLALECNCATLDRVAEIRAEISKILPGTQVIERGAPALARAEARKQASATAIADLERTQLEGKAALHHEAESRRNQKQQWENLAAVLVPLVMVACAVWIGLLTFVNVRQRTEEIGILRAIGLRSTKILGLFLAKALLIGLAGAACGYALGLGIGVAWSDLGLSSQSLSRLFSSELLVIAVIMAPLLSGLASWIPAMLAAQQDPAVVLRGE